MSPLARFFSILTTLFFSSDPSHSGSRFTDRFYPPLPTQFFPPPRLIFQVSRIPPPLPGRHFLFPCSFSHPKSGFFSHSPVSFPPLPGQFSLLTYTFPLLGWGFLPTGQFSPPPLWWFPPPGSVLLAYRSLPLPSPWRPLFFLPASKHSVPPQCHITR